MIVLADRAPNSSSYTHGWVLRRFVLEKAHTPVYIATAAAFFVYCVHRFGSLIIADQSREPRHPSNLVMFSRTPGVCSPIEDGSCQYG
jgi:hypothetical protein